MLWVGVSNQLTSVLHYKGSMQGVYVFYFFGQFSFFFFGEIKSSCIDFVICDLKIVHDVKTIFTAIIEHLRSFLKYR